MRSRFCRADHCDRIELHLKHPLPRRPRAIEDTSKSTREPWGRPAPKALDHSIAKATSTVYAKPFDTIMREVEYDYGACNMRTVQRGLRRLVDRGHILRIDLGQRLYAYVRPGSNMINELDMIREQFDALVMT